MSISMQLAALETATIDSMMRQAAGRARGLVCAMADNLDRTPPSIFGPGGYADLSRDLRSAAGALRVAGRAARELHRRSVMPAAAAP